MGKSKFDHKPLEIIFKKNWHKATPKIQIIFLEIMPYNTKIIYKKGGECERRNKCTINFNSSANAKPNRKN